jgi:nitrite reductase/ring-hydroxylating ferredoxin subunit
MSVRKTLCAVADIPDGGAISREAGDASGDASIVLLRSGPHVYAYRNTCPHTGRRLDWAPGRFLVENGQIVCAAHGACFVAASGLCIGGPPRGDSLTRVAIEIVDGEVRLA